MLRLPTPPGRQIAQLENTQPAALLEALTQATHDLEIAGQHIQAKDQEIGELREQIPSEAVRGQGGRQGGSRVLSSRAPERGQGRRFPTIQHALKKNGAAKTCDQLLRILIAGG